jgi:ABC-type multidrug transport system fused ATPase/permease subunit
MLRYPALATGFLVAVLSQGLLQGMLIWVIRNVLVALSTPTGETALSPRWKAALLILAVWLLRAISVFAAEVFSFRLATNVEHGWMQDVLRKLVTLPVAFFDRHSQGDLIMASYHDLKGIRASTLELGRGVLYLSQLLGLGVAAVLLSPSLAILGMLTVPLGALPAYWFGQRITRAADRERRAVTSLHDSFLQISAGIRAVRVNRFEQRLLDLAQKIGHDVKAHIIQQTDHRAFARLLLEAVSGFGLIFILTVGGRDVAAGRMEWPTLMGLFVAVIALYQPITNMLHSYSTVRSILPNLDRVEQILAAEPESIEGKRTMRLRRAPLTIELRRVSFSYGSGPVLRDLSATFHRGETIGIVGPSGAGKSTLMALLLGFYEPDAGMICYDGIDARRIVRADLMDLSALVLQEPFLFGASVAENIRAGRPNASLAEVERAAANANIADEIAQMADGYDTILGRGGSARGVSVGQKQRIAIASALLKDAPLLFLDEATSNLDAAAEAKVQAAIERLMAGRTTFVIAHRFSTLARADRILVLEDGRLLDFGTHDELVERCDSYIRLWASQDVRVLAPTARPGALRHA